MLRRFLYFLFGLVSYLGFVLTVGYAIGFIGNFGIPKSMDSPLEGPWQNALLIDLGLLSAFAIQHSGMARPAFKRAISRLIPPVLERSTFVLASDLALIALFWGWRPLGGTVWHVTGTGAQTFLFALFGLGWALVLAATFAINHFDLFGLRQVWRNFAGMPQEKVKFDTPVLYRMVRHPLYVGFLLAFWSTPTMTVTHLLFAGMTTLYILVAIQLEERDLIREHPEYVQYRKQVPMLIPFWRKSSDGLASETVQARSAAARSAR